MKKFMKENYLNSNIKLNRFNGFLSVINQSFNTLISAKAFIAKSSCDIVASIGSI